MWRLRPILVCNHIITVGDPRRALAISEIMDGFGVVSAKASPASEADTENHTDDDLASRALEKQYPHVMVRQSHRGFLTITGKYKGVPISVIAIGMG